MIAAATIFDKPAVAAPKQALTAAQREALKQADFYRVHRQKKNGDWLIGGKRFRVATIDALEKQGLIRFSAYGGRHLALTMAGQIVLERLETPREKSDD